MNNRQLGEDQLRYGLELQEFLISECGGLVKKMIDTKISCMCADMAMGKIEKGDDKGKYRYQTLPEIERCRGFIQGLAWLLDEWKGSINIARRKEQDRQKSESEI